MKKSQIVSALMPLRSAFVAFLVLGLVTVASAQEQVMFSFGASGYSAPPNGGVAIDSKGNLYVPANWICPGGAGYCPQFLEFSPPVSPNTQWLVQGLSSGSGYINAGLTFLNGNLYGTATGGTLGYGYVFQSSGQNVTTIYNFQGGTDATVPASTLISDSAGNLYGAAYSGQIFELKPPTKQGGAWTESVLYSGFSSTGVILDAHGNLFGMTLYGGTSGNGFVFELSPPASGNSWTEQVLYNFPAYTAKAIRRQLAGKGSAAPPKGLDLGTENTLAMDSHGNVFGTQTYGGTGGVGYVFELTPPSGSGGAWNFSNLYSFTGAATGSADGAYPGAGVTIGSDGSLYGTTYLGGNAAGTLDGSLGIIFKLSPPSGGSGHWTETVLRRFTAGFDGANPAASFVLGPKNVLYGVTDSGGGNQVDSNNYTPGAGTVFEIRP